jgi:hypothetical protein
MQPRQMHLQLITGIGCTALNMSVQHNLNAGCANREDTIENGVQLITYNSRLVKW